MDCCLIADGFSWFSLTSWFYIGQVVLGLGAVIFVHELGHFLVAKACGVKCEKFYLGFDMFEIKIGDRVIIPRSLLKWKWGETVYGIGIVPLGGYVKMLGQDDNPSKMAEEQRRSLVETDDSNEVNAKDADAGPIDRAELDPRSYQAKSVIQRMMIISAGVVMNLIFAVIFAAIAFNVGVDYTPTNVGRTLPGGPAWIADIDGGQIVAYDKKSTVDRYVTYQHLVERIALNDDDKPIEFTIIPRGSDKAIDYSLTPVKKLNPAIEELPALGFAPAMNPVLAEDPSFPGQAGARATPALKADDRIVEIEGARISTEHEMRGMFARNWDRDVNVIVERQVEGSGGKDTPPEFENISITIPRNIRMELGIEMSLGPITAIQYGSPAANSDLRVGDKLLTFDGQPIGDPLTLAQRMSGAAKERRAVTFVVARKGDDGNSKEVEVPITPRLPEASSGYSIRSVMAVEPLGIAFSVGKTIETVIPGSPAYEAGFESGDTVSAALVELSDELKKRPEYANYSRKLDLTDDMNDWPSMDSVIQTIRPACPIILTVERDGKIEELTVTPVESETMFLEIRGIRPQMVEKTYTAETYWESVQLGFSQTWRDMNRVGVFLKKLVTGRISPKHLGGPGTIAVVATSEASHGTSRLLLFLTLLSANLAIVNFLPIPVLDGGHMIFLAYEGIFRRPVGEKMQVILSFAGLIFIVSLMLFVIGLDIFRFSG